MHAPPTKKWSLLDLLNNPNNPDSWYCANCTAKSLPFNNLNDSHFLLIQNDLMDNASGDLKLYPDDSFNLFTESCETLALNFEDNDWPGWLKNARSKEIR